MADCLSPNLKLFWPIEPVFSSFDRASPLASRLRQIYRALLKSLVDPIQVLQVLDLAEHQLEADLGKERRGKPGKRKVPKYKAWTQARRDQLFAERKVRKQRQRLNARDRQKDLLRRAGDRKKILLAEDRFYRRLLEQHERDVLAKVGKSIVPEFQDLSFWTRCDLPRWRSEEPGRSPPIRVRDEEEPKVPHPYYSLVPVKRRPCSWGRSRPWSPDLQSCVLARSEFGMYYLDFGRRVPPHPAAC